jgi:hypothetical protein
VKHTKIDILATMAYQAENTGKTAGNDPSCRYLATKQGATEAF